MIKGKPPVWVAETKIKVRMNFWSSSDICCAQSHHLHISITRWKDLPSPSFVEEHLKTRNCEKNCVLEKEKYISRTDTVLFYQFPNCLRSWILKNIFFFLCVCADLCVFVYEGHYPQMDRKNTHLQIVSDIYKYIFQNNGLVWHSKKCKIVAFH